MQAETNAWVVRHSFLPKEQTGMIQFSALWTAIHWLFQGLMGSVFRRLPFLTFNWGVMIKLPVSGTWMVGCSLSWKRDLSQSSNDFGSLYKTYSLIACWGSLNLEANTLQDWALKSTNRSEMRKGHPWDTSKGLMPVVEWKPIEILEKAIGM